MGTGTAYQTLLCGTPPVVKFNAAIDKEKDKSEGSGDRVDVRSAQSSDQPPGFERHHGLGLRELPMSPPASTHEDSSDDNSTQEQRRHDLKQRREKQNKKKPRRAGSLYQKSDAYIITPAHFKCVYLPKKKKPCSFRHERFSTHVQDKPPKRRHQNQTSKGMIL
ncbi:hypothetical protein AMTR_s00105p00022970 [Amborella trichopoda]|uniref:Uncharacterized protein n=1 Tax=Amborella trichopoda TaxID=13333 RepID=W1NWJ9_AMBTC|nr:hypothetical protein AMTR_s00105p00022970 [Amborella trichopoda]